MSMQSDSGTDRVAEAVVALQGLQVHDVSPVIGPDMAMWFLYDAPEISPVLTREVHGAVANSVTIAEHTGTHVDAPVHFAPDGAAMDAVAPDRLLLKPFKKYDLTEDDPQPGDLIGLEKLRAAEARGGFTLEAGDVAIIEVGWDQHLPGGGSGKDPGWWGRNQPGLSADACAYLAEVGVTAVASDTAACDVAAKDGEILAGHGHSEHFLPNDILIVEGLTGLSTVPATGLLVALPLKIQGGSGSPLRVLLLTR